MRSYRCFRCGRDLSNEQSIELGIGPICRQKREVEQDAEDRQRQSNLTCHQGFVCYVPDHVEVTLGRFSHRFHAMAEQCAVPDKLAGEIVDVVLDIRAALGLNQERVHVPPVSVPPFGPQTVGVLNIPPLKAPTGGVSYRMPADHDDQYRRLQLRMERICPFGLDCRDPQKAVRLLWRLLSILRYEVEPLLATEANYGWAWDRLIYQHLSNSFECLGLNDDAHDVMGIVDEMARKPKKLSFVLN